MFPHLHARQGASYYRRSSVNRHAPRGNQPEQALVLYGPNAHIEESHTHYVNSQAQALTQGHQDTFTGTRNNTVIHGLKVEHRHRKPGSKKPTVRAIVRNRETGESHIRVTHDSRPNQTPPQLPSDPSMPAPQYSGFPPVATYQGQNPFLNNVYEQPYVPDGLFMPVSEHLGYPTVAMHPGSPFWDHAYGPPQLLALPRQEEQLPIGVNSRSNHNYNAEFSHRPRQLLTQADENSDDGNRIFESDQSDHESTTPRRQHRSRTHRRHERTDMSGRSERAPRRPESSLPEIHNTPDAIDIRTMIFDHHIPLVGIQTNTSRNEAVFMFDAESAGFKDYMGDNSPDDVGVRTVHGISTFENLQEFDLLPSYVHESDIGDNVQENNLVPELQYVIGKRWRPPS